MPLDKVITIFSNNELLEASKNGVINHNVDMRGNNIETIKGVTEIKGYLGINSCFLKDLGSLEKIDGDLWVSGNHGSINSLGNLKSVGGDCSLRYTTGLKSLGKLEIVHGRLSIRDSSVVHLGNLKSAGNLFLQKKLKSRFSLDHITVVEKVRFWNDINPEHTDSSMLSTSNDVPLLELYIYKIKSFGMLLKGTQEQIDFYKQFKLDFLKGIYCDLKGNIAYSRFLLLDFIRTYKTDLNLDLLKVKFENLSKYYPQEKASCDDFLMNHFHKNKEYENELNYRLKNYETENFELKDWFKFEYYLNKRIINADIIIRLGKKGTITSFCYDHMTELKELIELELNKFLGEYEGSFLDILFQNNKLLLLREVEFIIEEKGLKGLIPSFSEISREVKHELIFKKNFFFPTTISMIILGFLTDIIRKSENIIRDRNNVPLVGQGWISETILYNELKKFFSSDIVEQHGSPFWLGRQHLDIYFPKHNIGVEYQGRQHDEPIDFFGGQDAFEKTQERDERKRLLCEENGCELIYVYPDYKTNEILNQLKEIILSKG